ncbi:hypothetical protein D1007_60127 [Hordeum vulgare]|nr:hypothetical protein D1007_60127 [Hordeum vulgare]
MDASFLPPVTIEVAHAPSPRADLVAGHVGPAVAQASAVPARKLQGNVVVQGGNPAAPAAKASAPGSNAVALSRPVAEKVTKPQARRGRGFRLQTSSLLHPLTPSRKEMPRRCRSTVSHPPQARCSTKWPKGGSNNPTSEFMNLLDTNAVDIDQAPFAAFDYNETEDGVDDHGCEDDLAKIEAEAYGKSQSKSGKSQRSKNYTKRKRMSPLLRLL